MGRERKDTSVFNLADGAAKALLQPDSVSHGEAKGWTGRFDRTGFNSGFHVHIGALDVRENSEINVTGGGGEAVISAFAVTKGRAKLKPIGHPAIPFLPRTALVQHNRNRQAAFLLPGKQRMEFFSVAAPPSVYVSLLDGKVTPGFALLLDQGGDQRLIWRQVPMRPGLFRLIGEAGNASNLAEPMKRLRLEGIALQWLAELLDQLEDQPRTHAQLNGDEKRRVREARARLIADLGQPPTVSATAEEVGLSLKRLLHGFKEIYGETPVQLLRRERLSLARRLVEEGKLPLKDVAWRVGYHYVTNFVNAFTAEYGVSPRRMQRQRILSKPRRLPAKRPASS
jgi:AraC-like DNA-binding protein